MAMPTRLSPRPERDLTIERLDDLIMLLQSERRTLRTAADWNDVEDSQQRIMALLLIEAQRLDVADQLVDVVIDPATEQIFSRSEKALFAKLEALGPDAPSDRMRAIVDAHHAALG